MIGVQTRIAIATPIKNIFCPALHRRDFAAGVFARCSEWLPLVTKPLLGDPRIIPRSCAVYELMTLEVILVVAGVPQPVFLRSYAPITGGI